MKMKKIFPVLLIALFIFSNIITLVLIHGNSFNRPNQVQISTNLRPSSSNLIFYDDFEGDLSKWDTHSGLWHITEEYKYDGESCVWFGDEDLGHLPDSPEDGYLNTEEIDLSSEQEAHLIFYISRETLLTDDLLTIVVRNSSNSGDYEQIGEFTSGSSLGWSKMTYNISDWCGGSPVKIEFFADHFNGEKEGWYIDNLVVTKDPDDYAIPSEDASANDFDFEGLFIVLIWFGIVGGMIVVSVFVRKFKGGKIGGFSRTKVEKISKKEAPPLQETKSKPMPAAPAECPYCGNKLDSDAIYCHTCGAKLNT